MSLYYRHVLGIPYCPLPVLQSSHKSKSPLTDKKNCLPELPEIHFSPSLFRFIYTFQTASSFRFQTNQPPEKMARLAVTVTVFFFIIALSHARVPVDRTENDVTNNDLLQDLTESDPKTASNMIFLPSDKSQSEPQDVEVKQAVNEPDPDSDSSESKTTTSSFETVAVINFRPINRQFPRRPSFLFRHRRPCHHHAMRKPWGQGRREVSYGNDMLTTASDGSGDSKAERLRWYRGDGRVKVHQIPARWVNFHDGDVPKFGFRHEEDDQLTAMKRPVEEDEFKRPRHDNHGHHHHHHHHHHHEEEEEEHEHKGGLLKKIRKFLTHF